MMSLRHFLIFQTVAETGNFTKAASKLFITQPAVSLAIRELEARTGTVLFDRLGKRVQLTRSGRLLLEDVLPILAACEALEDRMDRLEGEAPIHIVSSITIAAFWLPSLLKTFQAQWPNVEVTVEVVSAANAMDILRLGKADLALIEGSRPQGCFSCRTFAAYALNAVCAPGYLCTSAPMDLGSFCSQSLLLREKGSAIRDVLDSMLLLAGHTVRPSWTSVNSLALIEAAKSGLGITVLPDLLIENSLRNGDLVRLSVDGLPLRSELSAIWHRDKYLNAPMKAFLTLLCDAQ
ncbi:LysR family transcriptional regulator [Ruminococcus sp. OA3]|uniref:LysR family transcriptional regulator n=1 Tax=Ruminococcus sp. OA3 TaxID=2914164 RepID=UPI001F06FD34|nr:LysR family transcriptional regulator [Ruminococcus sp. OA3]MCH1982003.1 LysR family transcriptional regulator [Ruminococcus sp. OA3]